MDDRIATILDVERYPLHRLDDAEGRGLVESCRRELHRNGMFNLDGFVRELAIARAAAEPAPVFENDAFSHSREHNIYFRDDVDGLEADHPALRRMTTSQRTICADQMDESVILRIYEWPPLAEFLAQAMEMPCLYTMADPLARVNAMCYRDGQQLGWHFDRSEFTITLLLQAPESGGEFVYRKDLRTRDDPNHDGVARLLDGADESERSLGLEAGPLDVFRGLNTPHCVAPVAGDRPRMVAVFSFYDRPDVSFSPEERLGFYGRAN